MWKTVEVRRRAVMTAGPDEGNHEGRVLCFVDFSTSIIHPRSCRTVSLARIPTCPQAQGDIERNLLNPAACFVQGCTLSSPPATGSPKPRQMNASRDHLLTLFLLS